MDTTAAAWRERGLMCNVVRRTHRRGFKAGALEAGRKKTAADLIAVFDADCIPPADYLERVVPHFYANDGAPVEDMAMVQARWGFLNYDDGVLTMAQSMRLEAHRAAAGAVISRSAGCVVAAGAGRHLERAGGDRRGRLGRGGAPRKHGLSAAGVLRGVPVEIFAAHGGDDRAPFHVRGVQEPAGTVGAGSSADRQATRARRASGPRPAFVAQVVPVQRGRARHHVARGVGVDARVAHADPRGARVVAGDGRRRAEIGGAVPLRGTAGSARGRGCPSPRRRSPAPPLLMKHGQAAAVRLSWLLPYVIVQTGMVVAHAAAFVAGAAGDARANFSRTPKDGRGGFRRVEPSARAPRDPAGRGRVRRARALDGESHRRFRGRLDERADHADEAPGGGGGASLRRRGAGIAAAARSRRHAWRRSGARRSARRTVRRRPRPKTWRAPRAATVTLAGSPAPPPRRAAPSAHRERAAAVVDVRRRAAVAAAMFWLSFAVAAADGWREPAFACAFIALCVLYVACHNWDDTWRLGLRRGPRARDSYPEALLGGVSSDTYGGLDAHAAGAARGGVYDHVRRRGASVGPEVLSGSSAPRFEPPSDPQTRAAIRQYKRYRAEDFDLDTISVRSADSDAYSAGVSAFGGQGGARAARGGRAGVGVRRRLRGGVLGNRQERVVRGGLRRRAARAADGGTAADALRGAARLKPRAQPRGFRRRARGRGSVKAAFPSRRARSLRRSS